MRNNEYVFLTEWQIHGGTHEISDVLEDVENLPRWCPGVYLEIDVVEEGGGHGIGKRVRVLSKGKLPYKLRWHFTVVESTKPYGFAIRADGDFVGSGAWSLDECGDFVNVRYDWRIRADKPLLRSLSGLLKSVFEKNHRWAMEEMERGLIEELVRRRQ